jgi:hypothetical protein
VRSSGYGRYLTDSTAANYLRDLGPLLLDLATSAKTNADQTGDAYDRGRQMGLYEAVSLVKIGGVWVRCPHDRCTASDARNFRSIHGI